MIGACRSGGAVAAVLAVAFSVGCGGSSQADVPVPTPAVVSACFKEAGATSVYQRKEHDVILVDGLIGANGIVSVELTGGQEKSEEMIERLETGDVAGLQPFEALEGAVVGVFSKGKPAGKRVILSCLE